jgi:hypothetical protein
MSVGGQRLLARRPARVFIDLFSFRLPPTDVFVGALKIQSTLRFFNARMMPICAIIVRRFVLKHSLDRKRHGVPSIQFNDHKPAFGLCLAAGYSRSGLGLQISGPVRADSPAAAATPGGALRRIVVSVKRCDLQIQGSDL